MVMNTITQEPGCTIPAPEPASQAASPPPKATEARREPSCGPVVDEIAGCYAMHPYDVAVLLSGILGNIAGPQAGLVNCHNILVRPATNVLLVDNYSARAHELEHALVQPLRARADLIRERAAGLSRRIADQATFGQTASSTTKQTASLQEPWIKEHLKNFESTQEQIVKMNEIPSDPFEYAAMKGLFGGISGAVPWKKLIPGINHLPSLYAERLDLTQVPQLLAESFQREVFLLHPAGGLFGKGQLYSAAGEQLAAALTGWLQGCDMSFPAVHPSQGHGSHASARAGILGAVDGERVGAILCNAKNQWNSVLHHCLLWSRSETPAKPAVYNQPGNAMITYQIRLHSLLERRCHGSQKQQCRTIVPHSWHSFVMRHKSHFFDFMDRVPAPDKPYVIHLHDLPERIMWVLSLLEHDGELLRCNTTQARSLVFAAFDASIHALRIHTSNLKRLREQVQQQNRDALAAKLAKALSIKGPLTFRELQRSTDSEYKQVLLPVIESLIQRGRVRQDSHQRYSIINSEKRSQFTTDNLS